jgi:DNA-directed RNA polymerase subunit alpha
MVQNITFLHFSKPQWRCLEYTIEHKRLHYGRFIICPLSTSQAAIMGLTLRKFLLSQIESTCISSVRFNNILHEYVTPSGFQESIHDILLNFQDVILISDSFETQIGKISLTGPKKITTADLILPETVTILDNEQYLMTLTDSIKIDIEFTIEKGQGYKQKNNNFYSRGFFPLDTVFMPVKTVNYTVHFYEENNLTQEMLLLEIWTNGSISPYEALKQASLKISNLFSPLLYDEYSEKTNISQIEISNHNSNILNSSFSDIKDNLSKDTLLKQIFIDQLELPSRAYNSLKKKNVHTVYDLIQYSYDDLLQIKNFGKRSAQRVIEALKIRFGLEL